MSAKVLVAHGNTQHLRLAVEALQNAGFAVVATPDGGDAFARFFEEMPDLVICNVALPSLSGANLARMVLSQSPGTPVVILTDKPLDAPIEGATLLADPLDVEALRRELPALVPAPSDGGEPQIAAASTAEVFVHAALKRFQRDNSLLALLDDPGITELARIAVHQVCSDGELVVKEGDPGHGFYFVVEGQVRVTIEEQGGAEVARINPGGFFGEMALLNNEPRSASVWTVGTTTLLWFDRDSFTPMLERYPTLREVLSGVALKRTEENLWRVLFDDDDVQRTLGGIADDADAITEMVIESERVPAAAPSANPATGAHGFDFGSQLGADLNAELADVGPAPDVYAPPPGTATAATDEATPARVPEDAAALARAPDPAAARAVAQAAFAALIATPPPTTPVALVQPAAVGEPDSPEISEASGADDPEASRDVVPAPAMPRGKRGRPGLFSAQLGIGFGAGLAVGLLLAAISLFGEDEPVRPQAATPLPVSAAGTTKTDPGDGQFVVPEPELPDISPEDPEPAAPGDSTLVTAAADVTPRPAQTKEEVAERKRLRRSLFSAFKSGDFERAVHIGDELRAAFVIDWEAEFAIAEAERSSGQHDRALADYLRFFATYPQNFRADDARFQAAVLYAEVGKKRRARALFKQVADDESSDFRTKAAARLAR